MTLSRLNELAREQWESGAHGDRHLLMNHSLFEHLQQMWPKPSEALPWEPGRVMGLEGIRVVLDDSLAAWHWELRDNTSRQLAESGWVYEIELGVVDTTGDSE